MRAVLFDFDGTLCDSAVALVKVFNRVAARHGYRPVKGAGRAATRELDSRALLRALGIPLWAVPRLTREARREMAGMAPSLRPIRGVPAALRRLRERGFVIAVVTSNSRETVDAFLRARRLEWLDDVVAGSSLFGKARLLKLWLREKRVDRASAIYVGDETRDVEAARKAGMKSIAVSWGLSGARVLGASRPDALARHPAELPRLVGRLLPPLGKEKRLDVAEE